MPSIKSENPTSSASPSALRDRPEISRTVIEEKNRSDLEDFCAADIGRDLCKQKSSRDEWNFASRIDRVIFGRSLKAFFLGARPRTWSASLSPVLIGACLAAREAPIDIPILFLTLLFSLLIQIGTNYANDYFDFVKNADTSARIGPKRAVQQGWVSPRAMLLAAILAFACAFLFAIPLMIAAGLWSFPIAALCILLGILYTGGPKPLGYLGLGELLVFFFFGPFASAGAYFQQTGAV